MSVNYYTGERVFVEVHNPKLKRSEWLPGMFQSYRAALDRPFRYRVSLDDGRVLDDVAPECVRKSTK